MLFLNTVCLTVELAPSAFYWLCLAHLEIGGGKDGSTSREERCRSALMQGEFEDQMDDETIVNNRCPTKKGTK
jgi:hypothetical protein